MKPFYSFSQGRIYYFGHYANQADAVQEAFKKGYIKLGTWVMDAVEFDALIASACQAQLNAEKAES